MDEYKRKIGLFYENISKIKQIYTKRRGKAILCKSDFMKQ